MDVLLYRSEKNTNFFRDFRNAGARILDTPHAGKKEVIDRDIVSRAHKVKQKNLKFISDLNSLN